MKLKDIIEGLDGIVKIDGKTGVEITGIACDSKLAKPGCLFIALKGSKLNGADFIDEAIDRGSSAVLLDADNNTKGLFTRGNTFIYTRDARLILARAVEAYFGDLSSKMRLIGVTGTNGKTTITYLIESLFKSRDEGIGVIGTVNYR